jgi:putative MATE family efflux protein
VRGEERHAGGYTTAAPRRQRGASDWIDSQRLLTLPPLRAILVLGVPTTGVMIMGALSNVAHTYFVSRLGGEAIAAVSLVYPINLILLTMVGGGLGSGIAAAVAGALGSGDREEADAVAEHAFLVSWILGVVATVGLLWAARGLFSLLGGRGDVLDEAVLFARVLFAGLLLTFTVSTFDSLLRGEGNVRVPTIWATTSLGLQIVFTPICMFSLRLGLAGAAVATLVGQAIGAVPRALHLFGGRGGLRPRPWPRRLSLRPVIAILQVGVPASLATLVNYLGLMALTGVVARYGTDQIAGFGLGTRLDFLILTLAFGMGSAVLTLTGIAGGAGDVPRVRAIVWRAVGVVCPFLAVIGFCFFWRPGWWLGLFTADEGILAAGGAYVRAVAPTYPFVAASMMFAFAYQGLRRAVFPLLVTVVRIIAVVGGAIGLASAGAPPTRIFALVAAANVAGTVVLAARLRVIWRPR